MTLFWIYIYIFIMLYLVGVYTVVDEFTYCLQSSVYINSSMFHKHSQTSLKAASNAEESVVHPLPNLFRLLGLIPFKKVIILLFDLFHLSCFDLIIEVACVAELGNVNLSI